LIFLDKYYSKICKSVQYLYAGKEIIETTISEDGTLHLPDRYKSLFGRQAKIIVLLSEEKPMQEVDLMKYSGKINWSVDGVEYQRGLRDEWH
jgi:hypothetical protein